MKKNKKKAILPIAEFREKITTAIRENPVVVVTAETGAGKSTQVPQYLLEEGYDLVVTQPRRLAARTVATRVAEEREEKLGETVGYRTAVSRQDSSNTKCLFCTDGLALVRELMGQNRGVLVLDEVHEWNENMEVLVAWTKRQIQEKQNFKVVIMSATLEAEKLAAYFNGAPVISVPGRTYPVKERPAGNRLENDVADLLSEGRNVLVFEPGKGEIRATISTLKEMEVKAEILPLHGQLQPEEQKRCFRSYGRPKCVISTNVAQTSVTIADIDAVVDSGMERRVELVDGVEGLYLKPISYADATQRKGRAGRTRKGIYIDHCGASNRPDFPKAEILRKRLDQTVLRLAIAGFDMEELDFFHQPSRSDIRDARRTLVALGCMKADGQVTKIGKLVNRLPVSVQYARMLVEADRLGVVDDSLTVAAIMEMGGITVPPPSRNRPERPDWRKMVPEEHDSDIMAQLQVWSKAKSLSKDEMRQAGFSLRNYFRAKEIRQRLDKAVKKKFFRSGSNGQRTNILKAVCAGMVDHLYENKYGSYQNGEKTEREIGRSSVVGSANWLVGQPFDLQIKTRRGLMTLRLIQLATKVEPTWLVEVAPHLTEKKSGLNPRFDPEKDCVVSNTQIFFNGQLVTEKTTKNPAHPKASEIFAKWLSRQTAIADEESQAAKVLDKNRRRQQKASSLNIRAGKKIFKVYSAEEMFEHYKLALMGATKVAQVTQEEAEQMALPELNQDKVKSVIENNPETVEILGERLVVSYGEFQASPQINLSQEMISSGKWADLSDKSLRLPGGRVVEILAYISGASIEATDPVEFKKLADRQLNSEYWNQWRAQAEPVEGPDPEEESSIVPVKTAVYKQSEFTGKKLKAFGTICWDYFWKKFQSKWFLDPVLAHREADKSAHALERLKVRHRVKKLQVSKAWSYLPSEDRSNCQKAVDLSYRSDDSNQQICQMWKHLAKVEKKSAELQGKWRREAKAFEQIDLLKQSYGYPAESIIVRQNGEVAVNCGKPSKMGWYEVTPSLGEKQSGPESISSDCKYVVWQLIPVGKEVSVTDFSGSGNINSEISFVVPSNLTPGAYALAANGEIFYPVAFWDKDGLHLPKKFEAVKAPEPEPEPEPENQDPVDLKKVDLSQLFGGGAKVR